MIHAFPCGTLALDFVGTLRARRNETPSEALESAADLDAWLDESGIREIGPRADAADLAAAIELREAIYALCWSRLHDEPLPDAEIQVVNRVASRPPLTAVLAHDSWGRQGTPDQALADLARQAVEILGGEDRALLRECARPECTQIYLDHSRGHRREWCSMQTCGSRVKAAAYRARKRGDQ